MKKNYLYLFFIALAAIVQGCKDDEIVKGAVFSLSRDGQEITDFTFGYGTSFIMVELTSNTNWTLSCDQPWCTLSNVSGTPTKLQYIKISVERNLAEEKRVANITMNAGGNIHQYVVTQASKYDAIYPEGMEKDAIETIREIYMGWNLGDG